MVESRGETAEMMTQKQRTLEVLGMIDGTLSGTKQVAETHKKYEERWQKFFEDNAKKAEGLIN